MTGGDFTATGPTGIDGESITSAQWGIASWWTGTAMWDDEIWDFSGIGASSYPRLQVEK